MAHNPTLANHQNVPQLDRDLIDDLHVYRASLEAEARETTDPTSLRQLYATWLQNEHTLQRLWNFPPNDDYIRFWTFPHCTCPKLDNNDAYPSGRYYISGTCPIHGDIK